MQECHVYRMKSTLSSRIVDRPETFDEGDLPLSEKYSYSASLASWAIHLSNPSHKGQLLSSLPWFIHPVPGFSQRDRSLACAIFLLIARLLSGPGCYWEMHLSKAIFLYSSCHILLRLNPCTQAPCLHGELESSTFPLDGLPAIRIGSLSAPIDISWREMHGGWIVSSST
jgi:hypothetical protein